jgi:hypothetical protein
MVLPFSVSRRFEVGIVYSLELVGEGYLARLAAQVLVCVAAASVFKNPAAIEIEMLSES